MKIVRVVLARNISIVMVDLNNTKLKPSRVLPLEVAVGILVNEQKQLLLTQRQSHQPYSNYWEFPGGKIEQFETPLVGLVRELTEEIGISELDAHSFLTVQHVYPEYCVRLRVFWVRDYQGIPFGKEGQSLAWCSRAELKNYPLLPANDVIIQALESLEIL
uniref:8-oxo-dGTP diphosphatase n=2 Tax=Candidatus Berkiella cookevillensis TaxID=437022 RepID=A0A0Q9YBW9_9GAMM